jgi:hypothetical protein
MNEYTEHQPEVSESNERRLASEKRESKFEEFKTGFSDPKTEFGPFMFWFWDAPLDRSDPAEMARTMASQHINPGYAHARHTMVDEPSLDPGEEWLSEAWFDAFGSTLSAAESTGTQFGYCDEYWWPSMRAAGRVVEENPTLVGTYLRWQTVDLPAGEAISVPESAFAVAARLDEPLSEDERRVIQEDERHVPETIRSETLRQVDTGGTWTAPEGGDWRVYAFSEATHEETFDGDVQTMPSYVDDELADAFIDIALEPYDERFGDRLGESLPGDFIDNEGTYGKLLTWSSSLEARYEAETGNDIRRRMPLMLDEDSEGAYAVARVDWFEAVSGLYAENYRRVTDWHERRGACTTGHFWEESLPAQARWTGDHLAMQRALSMPGQDCLGDNAMSVHDFKEAQSVAEFEGARFMTEFMSAGGACQWDQYNVTGQFSGEAEWETFVPKHIKQFSNAVFAWGSSHVIPHGVFTTRTLDGHPWPPDWYEANPMFPQLHNWSDFVRRASYVNSHGAQAADVLLVNPKETVWALSGYELFDETLEPESIPERWGFPEVRPSGERINEVDDAYSAAMTALADARIEYLVADTHYLDEMDLEDGRLSWEDGAFDAVILPPMDVLPQGVAELLVAFAGSGGAVYVLGDLPTGSVEAGMDDPEMASLIDRLRDQPTFTATDDVSSVVGNRGLERHVAFDGEAFDLLQHHRRIDGREVVWLANDTPDEQTAELLLREMTGAVERWDPETGAVEPVGAVVEGDDSHVMLSFDGYEACWLVVDPGRDPTPPEELSDPSTDTVATADSPWEVRYDPEAQPPLEHPVEPPSEFYGAGATLELGSWHDDWGIPATFSGRLDYATTVSVDEVGEELLLDLGELRYAARLWVNGEHVGDTLWPPHRTDVTGAATPGENEVRVRVANLVNNNYD